MIQCVLRPGLKRWLDASELSDGTLRFFCLCAAMLSLKPAPLMVLNEPESSLHRDLLEPLAELIARAAEKSETKRIDRINHEGKTMDRNDLSESGGKIWNFED